MKLWHSCLAFVLVAAPATLASPGASFDGIDASCAAHAGPLNREVGILACRLDHAGAIGVEGCDPVGCRVHVELQSNAWWYPTGHAVARGWLEAPGAGTIPVCEARVPVPATSISCYGFPPATTFALDPGGCAEGFVRSIVRIDDASPRMGDATLADVALALAIEERFELCRDGAGAASVTMLT